MMGHYRKDKSMIDLKNKIFLITGGTGSFGTAMVERLLKSDIAEIRIISRDEKKQHDMRIRYKSEKLRFFIGDVRDITSLEDAFSKVDYIFHAAAIKQVPTAEFFPLEAVKTNILGTQNVIDVAIKNQVKKVVCLSTDKAAYPINAMGISKSMMERVALSKVRSNNNKETSIIITRYGNVIGSRGSVIPLFIDQIRNGQNLTITHPEMTRFLMSLEEAIDLVLKSIEIGNPGDLFVYKSPSSNILNIAKSICEIMSTDERISYIGLRHSEKMHETLLTREEYAIAEDLGEYFRVPLDIRGLDYQKFLSDGNQKYDSKGDYNSKDNYQLSVAELVELLRDFVIERA